MVRILLIALGLIFFPAGRACALETALPEEAGSPQPVSITASMSKSDLQIGDTVTLSFPLDSAVDPGALQVTPPDNQKAALLFGNPMHSETNPDEAVVPVTILTSEIRAIGPLTLNAGSSEPGYVVAEIPVSVSEPVVGEDTPKDYTPFMQAPFNWQRALVVGSLVSLAASLILIPLILLARRRRSAATVSIPATPAVPPLEELGSELAELSRLTDYHARGSEAHYTRLSFALRRYFERVHQIPAVEMSDEEMMEWIRRRHGEGGTFGLLIEVFDEAGFAKFARVSLPEETVRARLGRAETFHHAEKSAQDATKNRREETRAA